MWPETLSATGVVHSEWILKLVEKLVRFIYRHCDLILVQSRAFIARVEALGFEARKIHYFPNSAEELYRPVKTGAQPASEQKLLPDGFRVMFAGNIGVAQDFETILAAAERLRAQRDIHWTIIGDGRMQAWVESGNRAPRPAGQRAPAWQASGKIHGAFLRVRRCHARHAQARSSFRLDYPVQSPVLPGCGRPIIAALDGEGARVVQESGAGLAVRAGDAAALAEAVFTLSRMSGEARTNVARKTRDIL